jgi:hypothetical protein
VALTTFIAATRQRKQFSEVSEKHVFTQPGSHPGSPTANDRVQSSAATGSAARSRRRHVEMIGAISAGPGPR